MLATQDPFEEAEQLQQQRGHWITAGVETRAFWPKRAQVLSFEGIRFLLQPAERGERGDTLPAIALRTDGQYPPRQNVEPFNVAGRHGSPRALYFRADRYPRRWVSAA